MKHLLIRPLEKRYKQLQERLLHLLRILGGEQIRTGLAGARIIGIGADQVLGSLGETMEP